ncbi:MAG: acyl-CoA reductase, partial [Marinirhabdus sp.]
DVALLDNGFLLLKEDTGFSSPISVVFFERYKNLKDLQQTLTVAAENIQCTLAERGILNEIPFGTAQTPALSHYADGVDTLQFLLNL